MASDQLYSIDVLTLKQTRDVKCQTPNQRILISLQPKQSQAKPISIKIKESDPGSTPKKFISDTGGTHRYWMLEPEANGGHCFHHNVGGPEEMIDPMFILVITQNEETSQNKCKIERIITSSGLVDCGGKETKDLFELIQTKNSDNSPASINEFFRVDVLNENLLVGFYGGQSVFVENLDLNQIDDMFVELAALQPQRLSSEKNTIKELDFSAINGFNSLLDLNTFAKEIRSGKLLQRLTRDNLPGYFLGPYLNGDQETEKFAQKLVIGKNNMFGGIHVEMYLTNPEALQEGQTHEIRVFSKAFLISTSKNEGYSQLDYSIKLTRDGENLNVVVVKQPGDMNTNSITFRPTGTKFIYLSFEVAGGMLYYNSKTQGRIKYHQTLSMFEFGMEKAVKSHFEFEKDGLLEEVVSHEENLSRTRWVKVEYKAPAGIIVNEAGFRVLEIKGVNGAYPPVLISSRSDLDRFDGCYYSGYKVNRCFGLALLASMETVMTRELIEKGATGKVMKAEFFTQCKVPLRSDKCLISQPGSIVNIEKTLRNPMDPGLYTLQDFEKLDPELKKSVYIFENNEGTKYMANCPYSCK